MIHELNLKESLPCNFYEEKQELRISEQDLKIAHLAQQAIQTQAKKHHHKHRPLGKKISHCWKKHKKAIIVTAVVIAVVVTIAATAGAAEAAPVAAGGAAAGALSDEASSKSQTPPLAKPSPPPPRMKVVEVPRDPKEPYALPEFTYVPDYTPLPESRKPEVVLREMFDPKITPELPGPPNWRPSFAQEHPVPQITPQSPAPQPGTIEPFVITDFSVGFAKGLPKGIYDSGEGCVEFVYDMATHPIDTTKQIVESLSVLADLAKKEEWKEIGKALSPELHQLITEWDTIPSERRGELAGYALGKHGSDLIAPAALAKAAKSCVQGAKELAAAGKNLQRAREVVIAEVAAGNTAIKLAEPSHIKSTAVEQIDALTETNCSALKNQPGFIGKKEFELKNTDYQATRNIAKTIQGRHYVGHALDQMQNRGILPCVVEETIKNGISEPNKVAGRTQFYDPKNNISVITENEGTVVTVMHGKVK